MPRPRTPSALAQGGQISGGLVGGCLEGQTANGISSDAPLALPPRRGSGGADEDCRGGGRVPRRDERARMTAQSPPSGARTLRVPLASPSPSSSSRPARATPLPRRATLGPGRVGSGDDRTAPRRAAPSRAGWLADGWLDGWMDGGGGSGRAPASLASVRPAARPRARARAPGRPLLESRGGREGRAAVAAGQPRSAHHRASAPRRARRVAAASSQEQ
eukprot:scaffold1554_cov401-Prasinococcus_capsulatus_cf.AAC.22